MQLIDFADACDMSSKSTIENFELFCFYLLKENGTRSFSAKSIIEMYDETGLPVPELSSLKKEAKACVSFRPHGIEGTLKFAKDPLRALEKKYGHMWSGAVITVSSSAPMGSVWLKNFAEACGMKNKTDIENFELFCYYLAKEKSEESFVARSMLDMYEDAGLARPDRAGLEKEVKKCESFRLKSFDGSVVFTSDAYRTLDNTHGHMWNVRPESLITAPSNSEVIDETKFCGRRDGFDKLIIQINSTYRNGSFDACAAVMKRLLEASLIFAFQSNGTEKDIRGADGRYVCFDDIVRKVNDEKLFGLPGNVISDVAKIGDYSGQGPMYTLGANDINSVRVAYRNVLETLFSAFK
jgi:hypothetical protein